MMFRLSRMSAATLACALSFSSVSAATLPTATRADFATELALSIYPPESFTDCYFALSPMEFTLLFKDVAISESYAPSLCLGMMGGYIDGYGDGTFRPGNAVTMAEASKMIVEAFGLKTEPLMAKQPWYAPYVKAMSVHHAIPLSVMNPAHMITMDEARDMIARVALGDTSKASRSTEEMKKWMWTK